MPYCTQCGKSVGLTAKFCGVCGKPILASQLPLASTIIQEPIPENKTPNAAANRTISDPMPTAIYIPSKSPPSVETLKMIVPDLLMIYSFGKSDTFNLAITTHRSIFAKLTKSIKEQSQKKRKKDIDNMKINPLFKMMAKRIDYGAYIDWYTNKTPQEILNETPGNYAIENSDITNILIKNESSKTEDGDNIPGYELTIITRDKTLKFKTNLDPENIRKNNIYDAYKN